MLEIILRAVYTTIVFLLKLKSTENIIQERITHFPVKRLTISKLSCSVSSC